MYKVFINEKMLELSGTKSEIWENLLYESSMTLEMAMDKLLHTASTGVCVYSKDPEIMFQTLESLLHPIHAGGGVVLNSEEKILFIHRQGIWDLPKGKAEKDEDIAETAVREVEEECGISPLDITHNLAPTFHVFKDKKLGYVLKCTHWFIMKYAGNVAPTPQLEEGITAAEWKDWEQVDSEVIPHTFQNIKLVISEARNFLQII